MHFAYKSIKDSVGFLDFCELEGFVSVVPSLLFHMVVNLLCISSPTFQPLLLRW